MGSVMWMRISVYLIIIWAISNVSYGFLPLLQLCQIYSEQDTCFPLNRSTSPRFDAMGMLSVSVIDEEGEQFVNPAKSSLSGDVNILSIRPSFGFHFAYYEDIDDYSSREKSYSLIPGLSLLYIRTVGRLKAGGMIEYSGNFSVWEYFNREGSTSNSGGWELEDKSSVRLNMEKLKTYIAYGSEKLGSGLLVDFYNAENYIKYRHYSQDFYLDYSSPDSNNLRKVWNDINVALTPGIVAKFSPSTVFSIYSKVFLVDSNLRSVGFPGILFLMGSADTDGVFLKAGSFELSSEVRHSFSKNFTLSGEVKYNRSTLEGSSEEEELEGYRSSLVWDSLKTTAGVLYESKFFTLGTEASYQYDGLGDDGNGLSSPLMKDHNIFWKVGLEIVPLNFLALRAGFAFAKMFFELRDIDSEQREKFSSPPQFLVSTGLGLKAGEKFRFDYTLIISTPMSSVRFFNYWPVVWIGDEVAINRFSLTWRF